MKNIFSGRSALLHQQPSPTADRGDTEKKGNNAYDLT